MKRGDTTLAWFATAMLLATAPFVARAQLDDDAGIGTTGPGVDASSPFDGGEGPGSSDASASLDGATSPDGDSGPRLPNGEPLPPPYFAMDAGGCSCRTSPGARIALGISSGALALVGLMASRRRRR